MGALDVVKGFMGAFLMEGVDVDKIDWDNETLYISLPKQSYSYNKENVKCAEDYARSIKETWIELGIFSPSGKVKYKTKDIYWTKEMGDKNFNDNLDKVLNLTMWD